MPVKENCSLKQPVPKFFQDCIELGETVKSYKKDVLTFRLEFCNWVDQIIAEATDYLSDSKASTTKVLLPKTPSLKVRTRKRVQSRIEEDVENAPAPSKSPRRDSAIKKISICLTRIDEILLSPTTQQKPMTPAKPPRRIKLNLMLSNSTSEENPSKQSSVLNESTNCTPNRSELISDTIQRKTTNLHPSRDTFHALELNLKRMSVSHRRSSIMRHKIRNVRRSQRLSQNKHKSSISQHSISDKENISEMNDSHGEADCPIVEIGVATCKENAVSASEVSIIKEDVMTANPIEIPVRRSSRRLGTENVTGNASNASKTLPRDNFSQDSLESLPAQNGLSSDADILIPKTPSPMCASDKVVRPKLRGKKVGLGLKSKSTTKVNKHKTSLLPSMSTNSGVKAMTHSKGYAIGSSSKLTTKARNSSILAGRHSASIARLSPKPMTPQEKQDKAREQLLLRELKTKENLRKRDQNLKIKIDEQKRRREEKINKVIQTKEHQQKLEEARLAKARELEEERIRLKALEKQKVHEEQEKRRLAVEKQMKEKEWEARRLQKEQRKKERLKKLEMERIRMDREVEEHDLHEIEKPHNTTTTLSEQKSALNGTFIVEDDDKNNYNMTPQQIYPKSNLNENNYDISQLKEGDSTDDESQPKKEIPNWAQGRAFKKAVIQQVRANVDYAQIFPHDELMLVPNLSEIFQVKNKRFNTRTSSAIWSSPIWKNGPSTQ